MQNYLVQLNVDITWLILKQNCMQHSDEKQPTIWMVSCRKGPTGHPYAWQIEPFWQDSLNIILWTHKRHVALGNSLEKVDLVMMGLKRNFCHTIASFLRDVVKHKPFPHWLKHWGWDKMVSIFQTIFSNASSWMKNLYFDYNFTEVCSQGSN